jgi:hypothetical protein
LNIPIEWKVRVFVGDDDIGGSRRIETHGVVEVIRKISAAIDQTGMDRLIPNDSEK